MLAPGEYSFPFQFHIPGENLPTSVEGNFGHVRYWLKAFIDRPWRFDITTKAVFTVIEHVDINVAPALLVSVNRMIVLNHEIREIIHWKSLFEGNLVRIPLIKVNN